MCLSTEMSLTGREKLSKLIETLVQKHRSRRAFARSLGVSPSAVISWQHMTSFPDMENLVKIANESGYTLDELQTMIKGSAAQESKRSSVDRVINEIQQLSHRDIARVIEAAARYIAQEEYSEA